MQENNVDNGPEHPFFRLSSYQWMDIIQYLNAAELKSLRLASSVCIDPSLTSHLELRMDRAIFFRDERCYSEEEIRQWLVNRNKLVIYDTNSSINSTLVSDLVGKGFLNSISQVIIFDCHSYRTIISALATLPNIKSMKLLDQSNDSMNDLEVIISSVGNMRSLEILDIEFDCVIDGSRLSFLRGLRQLKNLRLRGFNFSQGIKNLATLSSLESLHLCHGNFFSSPDEDVRIKDLMYLNSLTKLQFIHLEGFDCLTGMELQPLSASGSLQHLFLKHCQELKEDTLYCVGHNMKSLQSLHIISTPYEDVPEFDRESLNQLNTLSTLKSLSLFYALQDPIDLLILQGLSSLETLNLAFDDDVDEGVVDYMCQHIFPPFRVLKRVRIFSEEFMEYSYQSGNLDIEFVRFTFGDILCLD